MKHSISIIPFVFLLLALCCQNRSNESMAQIYSPGINPDLLKLVKINVKPEVRIYDETGKFLGNSRGLGLKIYREQTLYLIKENFKVETGKYRWKGYRNNVIIIPAGYFENYDVYPKPEDGPYVLVELSLWEKLSGFMKKNQLYLIISVVMGGIIITIIRKGAKKLSPALDKNEIPAEQSESNREKDNIYIRRKEFTKNCDIKGRKLKGVKSKGENQGYEITGAPKDEGYGILSYDCSGINEEKGDTADYTLKIIRDSASDNYPNFSECFRKNMDQAILIKHPSIARVYDWGDNDELGVLFFVMEKLEGSMLSEILEKEGAIDHCKATRLTLEILDGIAFLHRRMIMHGRINPRMIFITNTEHVKILYLTNNWFLHMDRSADDKWCNRLSSRDIHYYCTQYAPPDGYYPGRLPDAMSDLYAIGLVFYEMLTGIPTFKKEIDQMLTERRPIAIPYERITPPSSINPKIPKSLEKYVMRLLEKNPDNRYQSGKEAIDALKETAQEAGIVLEEGEASRDSAGRGTL